MEFLKKELEGLPATVQETVLAALEQAVRELVGRMQLDTADLSRVCGKIYGIMVFVQRFRKVLDEQEGQATAGPTSER
jgi:hypothetical protein